MEAYPVLRPIILVLKQIMYCSFANNPYKGGLSSYALILMVIAYIQHSHQYYYSLLQRYQQHTPQNWVSEVVTQMLKDIM